MRAPSDVSRALLLLRLVLFALFVPFVSVSFSTVIEGIGGTRRRMAVGHGGLVIELVDPDAGRGIAARPEFHGGTPGERVAAVR